ncbi:MAG: uroporphyrinogen-III synthase [Hyphomicrobiaceae bacterium]|nr:uroporphyrinogen-III synthase [Hyphomicrobiaceae bacterium]
MRLLVTRAEPDAIKLRAALERLGHEATVEPLLSVAYVDGAPIELDGVQALIATSRNALKALRNHPARREAVGLPLFAVGKATAEEARALGFATVITGAGNAQELMQHIVSVVDPAAGLLMHLAGDRLAADLKGDLEAQGFRVVEVVVYRTNAAKSLSEDAVEQIWMGEIEGVILLSPHTAAVYASLIKKHGLSEYVKGLTHFCLSQAVARRLEPLGGVGVEVAAEPSLRQVLASIVERAGGPRTVAHDEDEA